MRVLHVDTADEWRGGQRLLLRLVLGMHAQGVDVVVACPPTGRLSAHLKRQGVAVIDIARGRRLSTVWSLRRVPADVLVAHTSHAHTLALACRSPLVVHRWVDFPVSGGWKYQRPDAFAAVSEAVADILRAAGVRRVSVVPGGVDPMPDVAPAGDAPTVLAVGACVHHKGHDVLAQAAQLLPEIDIGVAGGGPCRPPGLRWMGPREDVPALLRGCRVFVMPSRSEGLGMAAVEALQAGVPVVASSVGGLAEVVGEAGILVPPEQPVALASAIRAALDGHHPDPALGRARVEARYTTEHMVRESLRLYRSVLCEP